MREVTEDTHPNGQAQDDAPSDWELIVAAPDFSELVKPSKTAVSREYTQRTRTFLKTALIGSLNANQFADAATILYRGPALAEATGQFADADPKVRKTLDIITAPDSPYLMFAMTLVPLIGQLMRNHDFNPATIPATFRERRAQAKALKEQVKAETAESKPLFTLRFLGRSVPVRVRFRIKRFGKIFSGFRAATIEPEQLTMLVFSDAKVRRALHDAGFDIRMPGGTPND